MQADFDECRAYVTHVLTEHQRLHALLDDARSTIAQTRADGKNQSSEVVQVLRQIRGELQQHFTEEEEGGCLDEAVSRLPRLAAEVDRIEAEHPDLLRRLDRLIEMASDSEKMTKDRPLFDQELNNFYQGIHAHEGAENRLLQQGFGMTIDGE